MTEHTITAKPFTSRLDGRPMLRVSITTGGTDYVDAYLRDHGFDVKSPLFWDNQHADGIIQEAMRCATETMLAALNWPRDGVDVEGLEGQMLVDLDRDFIPAAWRDGFTVRTTVTEITAPAPAITDATVLVWLIDGEPTCGTLRSYAHSVDNGALAGIPVSATVWTSNPAGTGLVEHTPTITARPYNEDGIGAVYVRLGDAEASYVTFAEV